MRNEKKRKERKIEIILLFKLIICDEICSQFPDYLSNYLFRKKTKEKEDENRALSSSFNLCQYSRTNMDLLP